jgi:radical SAM superfamily enzyme YgiQ (UPF0313 family)
MRVQLIFVPPRSRTKLSDLIDRVYPPLGILYLAGYLRRHAPGIELDAVDGLLVGWEATIERIRRFGPDLLLLSYITPCAGSAYALAAEVRRLHPGVRVAVGGPHATTLPGEALATGAVDFAVVGEGERTALELVQALERGQQDLSAVDGLQWLRGGEVVRNRPRAFIPALDDIPFPARDLVDLAAYQGWFVNRQTPETSVLFSRGCPFDCTFCTNTVWKSSRPLLRHRSPANIADELEALRALGIREVFDNSDELNCDVRWAQAVCQELKRRRLGMTWKAQLRATPLPEELVRAMAEAGCWYVHLGIESGNERTLRGIRKKITHAQVEDACRLLKKYGIKVFGLFMLFNVWEEGGQLAWEGVKESQATLAYAKGLIDRRLLDYISCTITTPYPGSPLFEMVQRHGAFQGDLGANWDRWLTEASFMIKLPEVTARDAGRVYFQGSLLRAYCYLRSGNWGLKDVPLFARKFARAATLRWAG